MSNISIQKKSRTMQGWCEVAIDKKLKEEAKESNGFCRGLIKSRDAGGFEKRPAGNARVSRMLCHTLFSQIVTPFYCVVVAGFFLHVVI